MVDDESVRNNSKDYRLDDSRLGIIVFTKLLEFCQSSKSAFNLKADRSLTAHEQAEKETFEWYCSLLAQGIHEFHIDSAIQYYLK